MMKYPRIKRTVEIDHGYEVFSAELEADQPYVTYPDFCVCIDSLKYLIHSELLGYDIDATHELFINADKRNHVIKLLKEKCLEDWFKSRLSTF